MSFDLNRTLVLTVDDRERRGLAADRVKRLVEGGWSVIAVCGGRGAEEANPIGAAERAAAFASVLGMSGVPAKPLPAGAVGPTCRRSPMGWQPRSIRSGVLASALSAGSVAVISGHVGWDDDAGLVWLSDAPETAAFVADKLGISLGEPEWRSIAGDTLIEHEAVGVGAVS